MIDRLASVVMECVCGVVRAGVYSLVCRYGGMRLLVLLCVRFGLRFGLGIVLEKGGYDVGCEHDVDDHGSQTSRVRCIAYFQNNRE